MSRMLSGVRASHRPIGRMVLALLAEIDGSAQGVRCRARSRVRPAGKRLRCDEMERDVSPNGAA
jgi:hypothetical protein